MKSISEIISRSIRSALAVPAGAFVVVTLSGTALTGCNPSQIIHIDDSRFAEQCLSICLRPENRDKSVSLPLKKGQKLGEENICECQELSPGGLDCSQYDCASTCDKNGDGWCNCADGLCGGGATGYCGDGIVNQAWEQCDGGPNCTAGCKYYNNGSGGAGGYGGSGGSGGTGGAGGNYTGFVACQVNPPNNANDPAQYLSAAQEVAGQPPQCNSLPTDDWIPIYNPTAQQMLAIGGQCKSMAAISGCAGYDSKGMGYQLGNGCPDGKSPLEILGSGSNGDTFDRTWEVSANTGGASYGIAFFVVGVGPEHVTYVRCDTLNYKKGDKKKGKRENMMPIAITGVITNPVVNGEVSPATIDEAIDN